MSRVTARGLLSQLRRLLYPPKCPFCRRLVTGTEPAICSACQPCLPWAEGTFSAEGFDSGVFVLYYEDAVRASLLRFKFSGCSAYSRVYAPLLAQRIADGLSGAFDLVSFVPVSRRRRFTRGYDQAELLAREVSAIFDTTPVTTLRKPHQNKTQSKLHGLQTRRSNVRGVYRAVRPERFAGKRVLLLDDIVTSGATLSEAARTLRKAGAAGVVCATLAGSR